MRSKPSSCEGCPAREWGIGFVSPEGPPCARVAFVGQGPGQQEAEFDRPFHDRAPSGWRLRHWLHLADSPDLRERDVAFSNVVWCWLPKGKKAGQAWGNRAPTPDEVAFCTARHLNPWLATLKDLRHIVPVGKPAQAHFLGPNRASDKYVGTTQLVEVPGEHE